MLVKQQKKRRILCKKRLLLQKLLQVLKSTQEREAGLRHRQAAPDWLSLRFQGGARGRSLTSRLNVGMREDERQPPWLYERQDPSMGSASVGCLNPRLC